MSAAGAAHAQQAAAPPPPAEDAAEDVAEEGENEIVIVAQQADDTRIDRRVYTLADDPISQSSTMLDVLGRLPSVTVAPSGAVRLLGSESVTIQVDGQVVPGESLDSVLRSLNGNDIERIEVITNPSAAYSAASEGGIINVITRQRYRLGLSGAASAAVDTLGGYQVNVSPTWTRGAWSYGLRVGANANEWTGDNVTEREYFGTGETITDRGTWRGGWKGLYGGGVVNFRDERRRASLNVFGWDGENNTTPTVTRFTSTGPLYTQTQTARGDNSSGRASLDYQQNGDAEGEVLKVNLSLGSQENTSDINFALTPANGDPARIYQTPTDSTSLSGNAKMDYERSIGEENLLAIGWQLDQVDEEIATAFTTVSGPPIAPDYASTLNGLQTTAALYGTYQIGLGKWTALPGVRVEHYRREVRSLGGETDASDIETFPSLHLRRNLAENLDLDLSYSRRIARPRINQLDPALRYFEETRASSGNPNLQPTMTDAFEANIVFQNSDKTYNITFYDRLSEGIVSPFTEVLPSGVIYTRPVNAGESRQRGLQAILRAPIAGRWRYAVSANLLNREFDVLNQGVISRRDELEYSGNAQVEFLDRQQSEVGADHVQFELQFQGPQHFLQGERDEFVVGNITWRRRVAEKLSAVLSVQDIFDSSDTTSELRTADFFERSERTGRGTQVRFQLTYQFGALRGPGGPPQDGGGPGGPPGGVGGDPSDGPPM